MKMFERLAEKEVIHICVGTTFRPNELYKRVLNFRRRTELEKKQGEIEGNGENEGNQVEEVNDQGGILFLSCWIMKVMHKYLSLGLPKPRGKKVRKPLKDNRKQELNQQMLHYQHQLHPKLLSRVYL